MRIIVNDQSHEVPEGCSVSRLLEILAIPATRAAVEVDRALVRRADHAGRILAEGARVEVVTLVGGG